MTCLQVDLLKLSFTCGKLLLGVIDGLNTPDKVLKYTDKNMYPNIHALIMIIVTLPVTSYEFEQSISMLRLIKSQEHNGLNGLAMLDYSRHILLTAHEVASTEFVVHHPAKLLLNTIT